MVFSNADRQKRFRQRSKAAADGVTPEMILNAAEVMWKRDAQNDPTIGTWEDRLAYLRTKKGQRSWSLELPSSTDLDYYKGYGADALMLWRVGCVVDAVLSPPRDGG